MGRSSGVYPSYIKLDIDHRRPPEGWRDGARRCIACERNWPNISIFVPTPCCNAVGGIVMEATPDMTWPEAVSSLLKFRFNRYYDKWNEGTSDAELAWTDLVPVSEEDIAEGMKDIEQFLAAVEESSCQA